MSSAAAKWTGLASLSAWQWRVMLTAPSVLLTTWLSLRLSGYLATLALTRPTRPGRLEKKGELKLARETAFALAVAIKYGPWRPRCLLRSLALARMLSRKGIASDVRIGLPAGEDDPGAVAVPSFSAHAWVEYDGVILNDREGIAEQFAVFERPPNRA